jgi:hypothetical protein
VTFSYTKTVAFLLVAQIVVRLAIDWDLTNAVGLSLILTPVLLPLAVLADRVSWVRFQKRLRRASGEGDPQSPDPRRG